MSDHDHTDEALEALYREGAEEPSAELDQRILAAAAQAHRRGRTWRVLLRPLPAAGLATAAVLVLAVGVLLRSPVLETLPFDTRSESAPATDAAPTSARAQREAPAPAPPQEPASGQALREEPAPRSPAAAEADRAIEEVMVTGGQSERTSDAARDDKRDNMPVAGLVAAPLSVAPASFTAPGCPAPYPLPVGAELRSVDGGLHVTVDGETYNLRCVEGNWVREEAQRDR